MSVPLLKYKHRLDCNKCFIVEIKDNLEGFNSTIIHPLCLKHNKK